MLPSNQKQNPNKSDLASERNRPAPTSHRIIKSFEAKMNIDRNVTERLADMLTKKFGTMVFLLLNTLWFALWILINTHRIPFIAAFDPFPFSLLTMVVSLEAIILAIIVLISQNRASVVDDLRQELDLQVNIIAEQELTKLLEIIVKIAEKNGVDLSQDTRLQSMLQTTNLSRIERALEKHYTTHA